MNLEFSLKVLTATKHPALSRLEWQLAYAEEVSVLSQLPTILTGF
jgi:hypothetical protein